jgi:26S proteasome regulatory subunit N11
MDRLLRLGGAGGMGLGQGATPTDAPVVDTAEQVYISSLALLKMLKHGRAGEEDLFWTRSDMLLKDQT